MLGASANAETLEWEWGFKPASKIVVQAGYQHFADIIFFNTVTNNGPLFLDFYFDNQQIVIYFDYGDGTIPDKMFVVPPPGFVAIPSELIVNDNDHGIIEIHKIVLG